MTGIKAILAVTRGRLTRRVCQDSERQRPERGEEESMEKKSPSTTKPVMSPPMSMFDPVLQ